MKTLFTLPIRYLWGRKLRTVLTTLAIVFGVAVIFAVNAMIPTLLTSLEGSVLGVQGQVDLTVSSATGEPFSGDTLAAVKNANGVAAASPAFRRTLSATAQNGGSGTNFELVGVDPATAQNVRRYAITDGRFLQPGDSQQAVLTDSVARNLGLKVGDTFQVPSPAGLQEVPVVGIVSMPGSDEAIMPLTRVQELFQVPGRINLIDVSLGAGVDREAVKNTLQSQLGTAYRVGALTLATDAFSAIQSSLFAVNLFGVLVLFMGAFLIFNTFRTVVVERRHDIGMLRAVGATRRTIALLIIMESAIQGIVGTALGLLLGYIFGTVAIGALGGIYEQYLSLKITSVSLPASAFVLAIVLGIGMTVLAGLLPAISASRVPVLVALRPQEPDVSGRRVSKGTIFGIVLFVLSVLCLVSGNSGLAGAGGLLFLAALATLATALVHPLARLFDPIIRWLFSREGQMAEGNLERQPGRSAVTMSALMIGLAIIVAMSSVLTSLEKTFYGFLDRSLSADVLLVPPAIGIWGNDVGVGPDFGQKLGQIPGIADWASMRYAGTQVAGQTVQILGIDPKTYPKVAGLSFDKGDNNAYDAMSNERAVVISPIYAASGKLKVGDTLNMQTPEGVKQYRVVGIGSDYLSLKVNTIFMSQANLAQDFHRNEDIFVMANLAPNANREQVKASIAALLKAYPQLTMNWSADWRAETYKTFDQVFAGLYIVLLVLIIPSLLGLINTLAINVLERTREIGVLRAIGSTRSQIQRLILAESLLLGSAGAVLGILGGLALAYAITALMAATFSSQTTFAFPVVGIIIALVVAIVMAIVASLLPARQAARLRITEALQYE